MMPVPKGKSKNGYREEKKLRSTQKEKIKWVYGRKKLRYTQNEKPKWVYERKRVSSTQKNWKMKQYKLSSNHCGLGFFILIHLELT